MAEFDFEAEEPTKTEAYETLSETARKWRAELRRETLAGSNGDPCKKEKIL